MKSDVKKKMMLDGHTTRTPKSLKRAQEENFFGRSSLHRPWRREFLSHARRNCVCNSPVNIWFKTKLPHKQRQALQPNSFFFRVKTSIICRHEISRGVYKWLLSTMSSSFPAAARRWGNFREAFRI